MSRMIKNRHIIILIGFVFFSTKLLAFNGDTLKTAKEPKLPKHYFNKTVYLDFYSTGKRTLDTVNTVSKRLKSYQVNQSLVGFNLPVFTKDFYNKDSTRISNIHFLFTGSYANLILNFGGISKHNLTKLSLGGRVIYNNGKKSIIFAEVSPFVTQDRGYSYTQTYRLATTVLYNYAASPNFSFRLGFTRSFMWGNRYHLPYVGIRVGRIDKVNFSIQFPRGITLNIPAGKYIRTSLFTRPQGGLYAFANTDSLQVGNINTNKVLYFGRNEFLSGMRLDVLPSNFFNFYISSGFTTRNYIAFFPSAKTANNLTSYNKYYKEDIKGSLFLNVGVVFRFGKTRSYYNSQQMYNAIDLNNSVDGGDNGARVGNGNVPSPSTVIKHLDNKEVLDLIDAQDLY